MASFGGRTSFRGASPIFFWGEQGTLGGYPRAYAPGGPGGERPGGKRKNYDYGSQHGRQVKLLATGKSQSDDLGWQNAN